MAVGMVKNQLSHQQSQSQRNQQKKPKLPTMICQKCQKSEVEPGSGKLWCKPCRREAKLAYEKWRQDHPKRLHSGRTYESRDFALRELGFNSYKEYLRSDLWRSILRRVYALKGSLCYLCGFQAHAIHHNRYHVNDLSGKHMKFVFPICNGCHERIEFSKHKHKKMPLSHAKNEFHNSGDHIAKLLLEHGTDTEPQD
jgi:hypothetical protein